MGWETRKRGGTYYTRSRRVNGRIVREYVGGGAAGELAALLDAEDRVDREARREAVRAEQAQARAASGALTGLEDMARLAIADTLHAEGFHRHKGVWRRRRDAQE